MVGREDDKNKSDKKPEEETPGVWELSDSALV